MNQVSTNPFAWSLQVAARERSAMSGQFMDLSPAIGTAFQGMAVSEVITALSEVLELDATVRPIKLDPTAISHELQEGRPVALGFTAAQLQAIIGKQPALHVDDVVLIVLSVDPKTREVKLDRATLRNTTLYP
ncbi:MAG: hypothetical protein DI537_32870 [Stutzerimonas stutzeri]|nr:MAG: hypothetical protein DI537_32870 [Stutzerimonas stutzeri]